VEPLLARPGDGPQDAAGMPSPDATNFAKSLVGLARQLLGVPPGNDALEALTGGDCNGVEQFVVFKHTVHCDHLFKQRVGEVHLLRNAAAVDLDLHHVRLLLVVYPLFSTFVVGLLQVGVRDNSDNCCFFLKQLKFVSDYVSIFGYFFLL